MATNKSSKADEAAKLLDDLDNLNVGPAPTSTTKDTAASTTAKGANAEGEAADVLAFLDEITLKSSEPTKSTTNLALERPISRAGTPTIRKSTERVKVGGGASTPTKNETVSQAQTPSASAPAGSGWGWGNVWNSASAAMKQVQTAVDEQVKQLPTNDARKWTEGMLEYAKTSQLDQLGKDFKRVALSNLTELLNVVAPPISEHEVIQVWLSHDMQGYDGVESLVYRSLARIMEQVEGGDLVVNRGQESKPKDSAPNTRELNAVESYEAAFKLAEANIEQLIKAQAPPATKKDPESTIQNPVTTSDVYLRIQPFTTTLKQPKVPGSETSGSDQQVLQFLIHLIDPGHQLSHSGVTQSVPGGWLDIWDQYDWVEDSVVEVLRVCVEVLGQEYIAARMGWGASPKVSEDAVLVEKPTAT